MGEEVLFDGLLGLSFDLKYCFQQNSLVTVKTHARDAS